MDMVTMGPLPMIMTMKGSNNVFNPNGTVVNVDDKSGVACDHGQIFD